MDLDTLFRGEFDKVIEALDATLREGWGSLTFRRTEPREIDARHVRSSRSGSTSRSRARRGRLEPLRLEVAADEGGAGDAPEAVPLPSLSTSASTLPNPQLPSPWTSRSPRRCTHAPTLTPTSAATTGFTTSSTCCSVREAFFRDADLPQLRQACEAIFDARASDAQATDQLVRDWPPQLEAHSHWASTYPTLAEEVGLTLTFDEAIADVNDWISKIAAS